MEQAILLVERSWSCGLGSLKCIDVFDINLLVAIDPSRFMIHHPSRLADMKEAGLELLNSEMTIPWQTT